MTNVTKLPNAPTPDGQVVDIAVELLEELLVKAKAGELRSVAVAYTDVSWLPKTRWACNNEFYKLMGGVGQLLCDMGK